jgi:rhodanese-related sulfurtransferase
MSLYKQGKLILVDVAPPELFRGAHILGAISFPMEYMYKMNIALPNNLIIAFYCG